jgi:hypothetical protein
MPATAALGGRRYDLEIVRGADLPPIRFRLRHKADGSPVDLTGAEIRAWVQRSLTGEAVCDMSVTVELPNVFCIGLPGAATVQLKGQRFVWAMSITWANGQVDSTLWGEVRIVREVPDG